MTISTQKETGCGAPAFEPPRWLRSPHLQTIVGSLSFGSRQALPATYHEIKLDDGDRLTAAVSAPESCKTGTPTVLAVHGLAGSVRSPYMKRITGRLLKEGWRVVRMNLRGAGASFGLARGIYHAGRTEDLRAVADWINERFPRSPLGLLGFSLGGNLVLKLAAEAAELPLDSLDAVVAVNPPIDLQACARRIQHRENRIYDRNFVNLLRTEIHRLHRRFPELGPANLDRIQTLQDFDDTYTAIRNGFSGAAHYYEESSAKRLLTRIQVDGLIIHAADDPFVPVASFEDARFPDRLTFELVAHGGHLGYFSKASWQGTCRWMDRRVTSWFSERWNLKRAF